MALLCLKTALLNLYMIDGSAVIGSQPYFSVVIQSQKLLGFEPTGCTEWLVMTNICMTTKTSSGMDDLSGSYTPEYTIHVFTL